VRELNESSTTANGRSHAGTIYTVLERLVSDGLVKKAHAEIVDGRARQYYDLTAKGVAVLQDEIARLRELAAAAAARLRSRHKRR
jgi:DNA-binding PadR family transcriptional regulator